MGFTPRLGPEHQATYKIWTPHTPEYFERVSCEEYGCAAGERGWKTIIDESTGLGIKQAFYIRKQSGRKFTEIRLPSGLTEFSFPSGQNCFAAHEMRIEDRPEIYLVKGGDKRGNPRGTPDRVHTKAEHWVEDFQENSDKINSIIQKG